MTASPESAAAPKKAGRWANARVSNKILTSVVGVSLVALITGGTAWVQMGRLNDEVQQLKSENIARLGDLVEIKGSMAHLFRGLFLYAGVPTIPKNESEQLVKDAEDKIDTAIEHYTSNPDSDPEWSTQVNTFTEAWSTYRGMLNIVMFGDAPADGITVPTEEAAMMKAFTDAEDAMNSSVNELGALEDRHAADAADEANSVATTSRWIIAAILLAGLALSAAVAVLTGRSIARRLSRVRSVLNGVAEGDLTRRADADAKDEVGQMALAVNQATDNIRQTVTTLAANSRALATSSQQLSASASQIADTAHNTASQTDALSDASDEVSRNVQTISSGAQEMGSAIQSISQSASDAADVAAQAVTAAESTNATVSKLGDSSLEIGKVVKVITSIAEQTNLLALNATIEAARAGDAGKGFAVVANEVKDLAQETAKATEDISRRVEAIQSDTEDAVTAIAEIGQIIGRINDYQLTIASAVEQQTATTREMNRSIGDAAVGTSRIADNISTVASAARTTTESVSDTQQAATELANMSAELQVQVDRFHI